MSLFFKPRGEERSMAWWATGVDSLQHRITPENAPKLAPVFAAFRHIVDYGSTLPVDAYRKDGATRTEMALPQLFAQQDAPGGPGLVSWLGQAFYGLALGNAVGWINAFDGYGFPADVTWLNWSQWSYDDRTKQWLMFGQPVPSSQIVHIPWIVPPGHKLGLSPLECHAALISAGLSALEYADIRRGGGLPPSVIKNTERIITPEVAAAMKSRARASFAKGEPFVVGNDWDFTAVTIPPNHAQFIETLNLSAVQVAAAYGLDPREVGGHSGDSMTYKTDESIQLNRANNMRPYIERIEAALARLLPARQFIRLNVDSIVRTDLSTRFNIYQQELSMGTRSINEIRALEDRPPVSGGDKFNTAPPPPPAKIPAPPGNA